MAYKKRRRLSKPKEQNHRNWSDLYTDLLGLILNKVSLTDALRFKDVCSSWNLAAKSRFVSSPLLMVPGRDIKSEDHDDITSSRTSYYRRFYSLAEKKDYKFFDYDFPETWKCVGSSRGWLVIMGKGVNAVLLNPFSRQKIELPLIETLIFHGKRIIPEWGISKAIVVSDSYEEIKERNKTWVVVIYGLLYKNLAYCNIKDQSWTELKGENLFYCDILGHKGRLYALSSSSIVEVWDFQGSFPTKVMKFDPSSQLCLDLDSKKFLEDRYFVQSYLVESKGEFLLVARIVGYYVNSEGDLLDEGDLLTDEDSHPLVCPYRTMAFRVYKMDLRGKKWEKVESLGDRALFLGGNESMSFSSGVFQGCEGNSIYFTDDNWDSMNVDYLYGGHDNGVYSLEAKAFKPCFEFDDDDNLDPPPFWIVPSL